MKMLRLILVAALAAACAPDRPQERDPRPPRDTTAVLLCADPDTVPPIQPCLVHDTLTSET